MGQWSSSRVSRVFVFVTVLHIIPMWNTNVKNRLITIGYAVGFIAGLITIREEMLGILYGYH